jgi:membrane-bound inhibitor of C-type lysozyme
MTSSIVKSWLVAGGGILGALIAGAAAAPQPPMDNFNNAFYVCDSDHTFLVSYDSDTPTSATMTTNGDKKAYTLKRDAAPSGFQFTDGTAKFWTDGSSVKVEGTPERFQNCKRKGA